MDTLSGSVERITFYNPENGYTVLRLRPEHQNGIHVAPKSSLSFDGLAAVVGIAPTPNEITESDFEKFFAEVTSDLNLSEPEILLCHQPPRRSRNRSNRENDNY